MIFAKATKEVEQLEKVEKTIKSNVWTSERTDRGHRTKTFLAMVNLQNGGHHQTSIDCCDGRCDSTLSPKFQKNMLSVLDGKLSVDWCYFPPNSGWGHQIPCLLTCQMRIFVVAKFQREAYLVLAKSEIWMNYQRQIWSKIEDVLDTWFSSWLWPYPAGILDYGTAVSLVFKA